MTESFVYFSMIMMVLGIVMMCIKKPLHGIYCVLVAMWAIQCVN